MSQQYIVEEAAAVPVTAGSAAAPEKDYVSEQRERPVESEFADDYTNFNESQRSSRAQNKKKSSFSVP